MVNDVSFKLRMRLQALLEIMRLELLRDESLLHTVVEARRDPDTAEDCAAYYRSRVLTAFPGCQITFTRRTIYLIPPDEFRADPAIISEDLNIGLVEAFTPNALPQPKKEQLS